MEVNLVLDSHDESSLQNSLFNLTQTASIASPDNYDFSSLNSGIITAGSLFDQTGSGTGSESRLLVVMSDFFSTDFDYPDSAVVDLSTNQGVRTVAVGISETVIHSHWMVTGLNKNDNLYLSERDGDLDRLKDNLRTAACNQDQSAGGIRNSERFYESPPKPFSSNEITKITKYYKKNGSMPDSVQTKKLLVPDSIFKTKI